MFFSTRTLQFLLLFLSIALEHGQILPSYLMCRHEDFSCYQQVSQFIINNYATTGLPALNLPPLEPFRVHVLHVPRNRSSRVSIDMTLTNAEFIGLSKTQILSVHGLDAARPGVFKLKFFLPENILQGDYKLNGEIYNKPIVGHGQFRMILRDVYADSRTVTTPVRRTNETYLQFNEAYIIKRPKRVRFYLTGLYDGNRKLSDRMLKFLNKNSAKVYRDWGPDIERARAIYFEQVMNRIFSTLPYRKFFLTN